MVGEDGTTGLDLVKHAESALEESKHRGKNTVSFFSSAMSEEKLRRLELSDRLQASVVDGMRGFSVHYQPLVDAGTLGIAGAEALIRYCDRERGMQALPASFIPALEDMGEIAAIDFFALSKACETVARWQREGRRPVSCWRQPWMCALRCGTIRWRATRWTVPSGWRCSPTFTPAGTGKTRSSWWRRWPPRTPIWC